MLKDRQDGKTFRKNLPQSLSMAWTGHDTCHILYFPENKA